MNWGYLILIAAAFSFLLILSQRIVARHARAFRGFIFVLGLLLLLIRYDYRTETIIGYIIALFMSVLFWVLIGRYNQPGDADEEGIRVYGLDD